jgi:hypothetical protein
MMGILDRLFFLWVFACMIVITLFCWVIFVPYFIATGEFPWDNEWLIDKLSGYSETLDRYLD